MGRRNSEDFWMKLLIATPAYQGSITTHYFNSAMESAYGISADNNYYQFLTLANHSLIPRARNTCVTYGLMHDFDKLLFIDADLAWSWENMKAVIYSDKDIVGGSYPIKAFPISVNFNPLPDHNKKYFQKDRQIDSYFNFVKNEADENNEVEVLHIPTGFMCVKMSVFKELIKANKIPWYTNYDTPSGEKTKHYDFFPIGVTPNNEYLSEDWAFCEIAREAGFKIYMQTKAILQHTGTWHYDLGQFVNRTPKIIPDGKKR